MGGLEDQIAISRTDDAILVTVTRLAKLLGILWTTRAIEKDARTFMLAIQIAKEKAKEETKEKAKTKTRKARTEENAEEEDRLAILEIAGTLMAHIKTINLYSHLVMMDYDGIVTNLGTPKEITRNW